MSALQNINVFLGGVDLEKYRSKYARIKLVELDLDRNIQALHHLYREYWERRARFPSFEEFYDIYSGDLRGELENFRRDKMFSKETFYRGMPARIYRTWASLLTQIQGGYAAEAIYGRGNVEMKAALDYRGIDIRLTDGGEAVNLQIKKETVSREVRAPWQHIKRNTKIVTVVYEVPGSRLFLKSGEPNTPFRRWRAKWRGKLARLDNGFIVFLPEMFAREHIRTP
ncbi:MAG: TaqI family restriction endonuclease [Gammaproteobacteria bacterium]